MKKNHYFKFFLLKMFKSNLFQKSKKNLFFSKIIFFFNFEKLKQLFFSNLIFLKIEKIKKNKNEKKSLFQKFFIKNVSI